MTPTYRLGTPADTPAVYAVFAQAIADLDRRMGTPEAENTWLDPVAVAASWEQFRPLFEHLARTAEQFWVAEGEGQIVGYARATLHDGFYGPEDRAWKANVPMAVKGPAGAAAT